MLNQKVNNKGQALIEFVIILPIIMMIIFVVIDFSNVFYQKNNLESVMNAVVSYKENGKSDDYVSDNIDSDVKVIYKKSGNDLKISISKSVKLITPFSSMFFDNPYIISTERTVINE